MNKQILVQLSDTIRIVRYDKLNVAVEQFTTGINNKTKEEVSSWKTISYHGSIKGALHSVLKFELLSDINTLMNLENMCEELHRGYSYVEKAIDDLKEVSNE